MVSSIHNTQKSVDIDDTGRFIQNWSTVDIDRRSGQTIKMSVDIEFAFTYFIIPTDQNDLFGHVSCSP